MISYVIVSIFVSDLLYITMAIALLFFVRPRWLRLTSFQFM